MGGGILPLAIHNNQFYFLFSREVYHNNKSDDITEYRWSDFGGKKDNNETYFETALREGFEESNGFLGNIKNIKNLMDHHLITTIHCNKYNTYIVLIDYDEDLPKNFEDEFNRVKLVNPEKICKDGLYEKDKLKWITYKDLENNIPLFRKHYVKTIRKIIASPVFKML